MKSDEYESGSGPAAVAAPGQRPDVTRVVYRRRPSLPGGSQQDAPADQDSAQDVQASARIARAPEDPTVPMPSLLAIAPILVLVVLIIGAIIYQTKTSGIGAGKAATSGASEPAKPTAAKKEAPAPVAAPVPETPKPSALRPLVPKMKSAPPASGAQGEKAITSPQQPSPPDSVAVRRLKAEVEALRSRVKHLETPWWKR